MRHQEQRGAAFGVQGEEQIGDARAGGAVEIAGGLVGEQDLRPRRQGAGQRHALLLAARQLAGIVIGAQDQPHGAQLALGAVEGVRHAHQFQRHRDIFQRRHGRDQVKRLEHDADLAAAKARQRVLAHVRDVGAGNADAPRVSFLRPAATISSDDFPEPDGPVSATVSPCRDGERDAGEDVDRSRQAFQGQAYVLKLEGRRGIAS